MEYIKKEIKNISEWMKTQCNLAGAKGFVVGISGGIDSTAACGLAVEAVGKENVLGVLLPSVTGYGNDEKDGRRVASHFGISYVSIGIGNSVNSLIETLESTDMGLPVGVELTHIAIGNIQARLRMVALRAIAEMNSFLVVGTTNLSEDFLGYFTKGGDGGSGVDIEPMAKYFKSEIKDLVEHFGLPEDLINRTPSAGLWEGQTDEDELGYTYDDIEKYWRWRTEQLKKQEGDIIYNVENSPVDYSVAVDIENMHIKTEHKRNMPPSFPRK